MNNLFRNQCCWLLSIACILGCALADNAKLKPVVLQLKWRHQFNFAGYYAAEKQGYFKDAGLDVTIKEGLPGTNFIEEVVQGRADYGIEMPDLLIARANGKPVVVLAAIFQHSPYILLTTASSGITSPQQAVGKTVMIREASAAELRSMFVNEGIDLKSINIVPHTWDLNDLARGKVDAVGAYLTDQPYILKQREIPYHIIRPRSYGIDFYGDCLFTSEDKIQSDPQQVWEFRNACIRGWEYAMANPEEIIDVIKNEYKSEYSVESMRYEHSVLKKEIILPDLVEVGHMNPGRWAHIASTYRKLGMISKATPLDGFIYTPISPHEHWYSMPWVRGTLIVSGALFAAILCLLATLAFFNKRLKHEVTSQTHEIAKKEELFRALFNNSFQLTGMLDIEGRVTMVNSAALDLIKKKHDDVAGKYFWDTPWWEHSSNLRNRLKEAVAQAAKGQMVRFDATHLSPDGETHYIDFSIKPVKDNEGNIICILPEGRDITEKKLTEERYRNLFEQAGDAIIIFQDGKVVECNQKALQLFECKRDWLVGSMFEPLSASEQEGGTTTDLISQYLSDVLVSGTATFEWRSITAKKRSFTASVSLSRFMFGKGESIQAIIRDISESKELEQKLRLSQKMEAIGTLAGGIAHDFNNILAGILGFNELALNEVAPGTKLEYYLTEMLKSADRARELVDQILTFSRHSELGMRPIRLGTVIDEALKLLRATIPSSIDIKSDIQSESNIYAEPTQLHQVVMNLCTNAYHALEHNTGVISIRLKDVTLSPADIEDGTDIKPGSYVQLDVSDSGKGMSSDIMQKIFEPYFTTKPMGKGTGLGLAVVHGIVANHKGHISVKSQVQKGTTFTLLLPLTTDALPSSGNPADDVAPKGNGEHILFVDDEDAIARLSEEALTAAGYQVTSYTNPKDALEEFLAAADTYDLVITDMTMPGLSGHQLAQKLIAHRQDIPIIMCSGYSEEMTRTKALEAGIKEYLIKPVLPNTLLATINGVLSNHK